MTESHAHLRIGIDTGGTFTDIVCVDGASGEMRVTKVASTPSNPAIGLVRGVKAILDAGGARSYFSARWLETTGRRSREGCAAE